jgi:hypothetical protein
MSSSDFPYLKIQGSVNPIIGQNTIIGNPMRNNLFPDQPIQDLRLITKWAKNPARMKNKGIRQT